MQDEPGRDSERAPEAREVDEKPPVVALGASAGGLEALKAFLEALPTDTGACFVFVQHLDPTHKSMLPDLLRRCTTMEVVQAEDNMPVAADKIILIPPDSTLTIAKGILHLTRPAPERRHRTPIDTFLESLADDQGERGIGIILSGTGSDGTEGLRRLKEAGALTIVQEPSTAKYDSMPRSAAATTMVDHELAPEDMPAVLIDHFDRLNRVAADGGLEGLKEQMRSDLAKICSLLRARTGQDFREYKDATLIRRIHRRMQVLKIEGPHEYVERLREDAREARNLFRELIISVTSFFRDPRAFDALTDKVLRPMVAGVGNGGHIRVWVPACASGEEAYTLAMILRDLIDSADRRVKLQIFATDIDEAALEVARRGCYAESIVANVPPQYRKRFLRPDGPDYRVVDELREVCIFSTQSVIKDPPFSRLDLVSCRNLLIYLKPELQNRLVPIFHYALREGGVLFLGSSENVTKNANLFETVDAKWRIFRRREVSGRANVAFPLSQFYESETQAARERRDGPPPTGRPSTLAAHAERLVLDRLGPAYAVIGENREVLHTGGNIEQFFVVPRGPATQDVLAMTRPELRMDVRAAMHRARQEQEPVTREGITFKQGDTRRRLRIECAPLVTASDGHKLVLVIHDCGSGMAAVKDLQGGADHVSVQALESELRSTKEYLQTTTEELESSNEELKSANEELMSMNEELQSSNEELETSKEELQSVNEELETVNAELSTKVEELSRSNADLENLFESTQIATIFLDRHLRVRRFTPVAKEIFHLIDGDYGRPITDIAPKIADLELENDARAVISSLAPVEREVRKRDGHGVYIMRLLPYRTADDVIDGVVATFVDVTALTAAQQKVAALNAELRDQLAELEVLLNVAPVGIAFASDLECNEIYVNTHGAQMMRLPKVVPPAGTATAPYRFLIAGEEVAAPNLPLQKVWRTRKPVHDFRATYQNDDGTSFEYLMSAAPVFDADGQVRRVVGVFDDISALVAAQTSAERRAAQHNLVATLSSQSLRQTPLEELLESAAEQVARTLGADYAKVLQYRPASDDFLLRAHHNMHVTEGEEVIVPGGLESQAGFTLTSGEPVIVESLKREERFSGPQILHDHEVQSGLSTVIEGADGRWGVLGVHSRNERSFSADEVTFVQSVANVLSSTIVQDEADRLQKVLLAELRHRVKNTLATVNAIASLSFRGETAAREDVGAFQMRLKALADTHDLLFQANWQEVDLAEIVERQLRPFPSEMERIVAEGPGGVMIDASSAMSLGMILHELLTNACKYGALSVPSGRVQITWETRGDDGGENLRLDWVERDGPEVEPPTRQGIGSSLINDAANLPDGEVDLQFDPAGLRCRFEMRLSG